MKTPRRLTDLPQQTPPPGWETHVGMHHLGWFHERWVRSYGLELDPPFQRGHVWTDAQRSAWMEHVVTGGYTGRTLTFNCPGWQGRDERGPIVLVDGKQRIETLRRFADDAVPVFGRTRSAWQGAMDERTGWARGRAADMVLRMHALRTEAEIMRWYLEMNAAGTPHGQEELERVRALVRKAEGEEA